MAKTHLHNWILTHVSILGNPAKGKPMHGAVAHWLCRCGATVDKRHPFRAPRSTHKTLLARVHQQAQAILER